MIDENLLASIKGAVGSFVDEKRMMHILGVEEEASKLGTIFAPDKVDKLRLSALLHDITKCFDLEKQISLCNEYDIEIDPETINSKLLHAKTGCEFAKRTFGSDIVDSEVYEGILYHTTGRAGMTLFEQLIYLADYIEPGRTFPDCIKLRDYFYENIYKADTVEKKEEVLTKTMIYSFNLTIKNLIDENRKIDYDTIKARNYFISK